MALFENKNEEIDYRLYPPIKIVLQGFQHNLKSGFCLKCTSFLGLLKRIKILQGDDVKLLFCGFWFMVNTPLQCINILLLIQLYWWIAEIMKSVLWSRYSFAWYTIFPQIRSKVNFYNSHFLPIPYRWCFNIWNT